MDHAGELTALFRRAFVLSNVKEGELVGVLTEPKTRPAYTTAALAAAATLDAHVFEVSVPGLGWDAPTIVAGMGSGVPALGSGSPVGEAVAEALARCDFVVDLTLEAIIHVPLREVLREAACRILSINEPPDALERLFPSPEIKQAVLHLREIVLGARTLKLTSAAGTDMHYDLSADVPIPGQWGYADEPGRWDHWPSALISTYPVDGTARGTLVIDVGDMLFPHKRYVESRVTLEIDGGYVRSVSGGLDAELIRGYLDSWGEDEVYATSHVALGVHPAAQWSALAFYEKAETHGMDARCMSGGVVFSTGPNRWVGRWVEAHLDIPMRACTVELDGTVLIDEGRYVDQRLRPVVRPATPTA
jgi:2,5-dihydroxypyridine 5,6-dioxygenase